MAIQIAPVTADDYPTLAHIRVISFKNNRLNHLMFPNSEAPENEEVSLSSIQDQAQDPHTQFYKAVDTETGEIAGYTRWALYPKGRSEEEFDAPGPQRPENPEVNVELKDVIVRLLRSSQKKVMGGKPYLCRFAIPSAYCPPQGILAPIYPVSFPFLCLRHDSHHLPRW
jgi:hypothetical protein